MEEDLTELQGRHVRFQRQMLLLAPLVVLWVYSISSSFVLSGAP
jgi:hypothetical protein